MESLPDAIKKVSSFKVVQLKYIYAFVKAWNHGDVELDVDVLKLFIEVCSFIEKSNFTVDFDLFIDACCGIVLEMVFDAFKEDGDIEHKKTVAYNLVCSIVVFLNIKADAEV